MLAGPRLRQVALVASQCDETARQLQAAFGWADPFHDPGVRTFGLANAVFAAGDTFVEVVAPVEPATTAGRYLERRGGDSGYMAIFQMPDLASARQRVAAAGVRVVWATEYADIAGLTCTPRMCRGRSCRWTGPIRHSRGGGRGRSGLGTPRRIRPVACPG